MQSVQPVRSLADKEVPAPVELMLQVPFPNVSPDAMVTVPDDESKVKAPAPPDWIVKASLLWMMGVPVASSLIFTKAISALAVDVAPKRTSTVSLTGWMTPFASMTQV